MSQQSRQGLEIKFTFLDGQSESSEQINIEQGAFGTLIVPVGSGLIGKSVNFTAVSAHDPARFAPVGLLSAAKMLAEGANALTSDEIRECGAISNCKLTLDTAVSEDSELVLLWKA